MLNHIRGYITNGTEELSWAPEVPLAEVFAQPWMLTEKLIRAFSFKQLQRFCDAKRWWKLNKQVYMVGHNFELVNFAVMLFSNFVEKLLTVLPYDLELERVFGVFRLPYKMESVLSN